MTAMTPCPDRPGLLPRLSSTHVPRRSLSEPLLTSEARVKLLCAPAGSGKSALFAECFLQAPPVVACIGCPWGRGVERGANVRALGADPRLAEAG